MSYKETILAILKESTKGLHISEIADRARVYYPNIDSERLQKSLNQAILSDISNNKTSSFRRVKGEKGRNKRGYYKLKRERRQPTTIIAENIENGRTSEINVDDNYKAKAGEYAVLSELMFHGYNAGIMAIDEGIDVVAIKGQKQFYIQVKTRTIMEKPSKLTPFRQFKLTTGSRDSLTPLFLTKTAKNFS